jgi:hypothetical protein
VRRLAADELRCGGAFLTPPPFSLARVVGFSSSSSEDWISAFRWRSLSERCESLDPAAAGACAFLTVPLSPLRVVDRIDDDDAAADDDDRRRSASDPASISASFSTALGAPLRFPSFDDICLPVVLLRWFGIARIDPLMSGASVPADPCWTWVCVDVLQVLEVRELEAEASITASCRYVASLYRTWVRIPLTVRSENTSFLGVRWGSGYYDYSAHSQRKI